MASNDSNQAQELKFADLKKGQSVYLRVNKDTAKKLPSGDTVQGFHVLLVVDEQTKQAGLPVLKKRLTLKAMEENSLWEFHVIERTN